MLSGHLDDKEEDAFFYCRVEIYFFAFQIKKCISSTIGKFLFI